MIESNVINWLDFGDSIQKIDIYSKNKILFIFRAFRILIKNRTPVAIEIILMIISFLQLLCVSSFFIEPEEDILIIILNYFRNIFLVPDLISIDSKYYIKFFIANNAIIYIDIILFLIILFTSKIIKLNSASYLINLINTIIFYYYIGPAIEVSLMSFWCEENNFKFISVKCNSSSTHILYIFFSMLSCLLFICISLLYSIFYNEIGSISIHSNEKFTRIDSKYELYSLFIKIIIFTFYSIIKMKENINKLKIIFIGIIFFLNISISIYIYKFVYYYYNIINYIIYIGWVLNSWLCLCIFLKEIFEIKNISSSIVIGWVILIILIIKMNQIKEKLLVTQTNILDFENIKDIEMYNNILLNHLVNKNDMVSKIFLYGNIKIFEEYLIHNPELNYHYQKLLKDNFLNKKLNNELDLQILSFIYIIYTIHVQKTKFRDEIALYMSYFLINKLNNINFAIYLCSKINASGFGLYYKYLLSEEIKENLIYKLNNPNNESITHVQIGCIILYYLYIELLKIKIYDGINGQVDYFEILKSNVATTKSSSNLLKTANKILNTKKEILKIWKYIIKLNPFSDEAYKDYMLYLDNILQDTILAREESKNYNIINGKNIAKKNDAYHNMFLIDKSSILLIDGYLSTGKILYSSPNFPILFGYNSKDILNFNIDDLLPNVIQSFHKEVMEEAIKYSNIEYKFKKTINSLLKNKNGGICKIKLFIKTVPNLNFGLIYYAYLQKEFQSNFLIIADKELKINGFSEMVDEGSSFTMGLGYNLSHSLYGYHIGLIIPDILPLLVYQNDEFHFLKKDLELKGYLYQVNDLMKIKSKVDIILNKIKNNKNNNQPQYEDCLQNINEEFNKLITELNNQKIKPFSIFYTIQMFSFLEGKYKYYRINITDDIITGNEKIIVFNKKLEESKKFKSSFYSDYKSISKTKISKETDIKKKNHEGNKIIKIGKQILDSHHQENLNEKIDINEENNEKKNHKNNESINNLMDNNEKEKSKSKKNNKINIYSSPLIQSEVGSNINKIKLKIMKKKDPYPLLIMKYSVLAFIIITIFCFIYNNILIKEYFNDISFFFESNLIFNMTKMSVAIIYIMVLNIKWELHHCLISVPGPNYTELYDSIIETNIDYLLKVKNATNKFGKEFRNILESKRNIKLNIYGYEEKFQNYNFNFENIINYIINGGINTIKLHSSLLKISSHSEHNLDPLSFGFNEIVDLQNETYTYYYSDINGFIGKEKNQKIKSFSNIFPLIINSIIIFCILILYIFSIIKMNNLEVLFLEKLINFNSTNFEDYLKNLDKIKKKLQNDNNVEEEEKEEIDINDSYSKKISKKEDNQNKELNEKKQTKKFRTDKNKAGKAMKQKRNKIKIMSSFFIKKNIFFIIQIIFIIIISLSYYIVTIIIEINKKNEFLKFDELNNDIICVFKDSFDTYMYLKKELEYFEDTLDNCKVTDKKYIMRIPTLDKVSMPSFGNSLIQITQDFGFKGESLSNFTLLFKENACKVLDLDAYSAYMCVTQFNDYLFLGIENTISRINSNFGTIIEEFNSINGNGNLFLQMMNRSRFRRFEVFIMFYYQNALIQAEKIFNNLRSQELENILFLMKIILIIYAIVTCILFCLVVYLVNYTKSLLISFLSFIGILPFKYIIEDEKFYKEIISFGNSFF